MAETEAMIGYGTKFEVESGDGEEEGFIEVAEVFNITPPSDTIDVIDATHMQSPDATREFILGLRDPGECTFEINFIPGGSGDAVLQSWRDARERRTCRITFPNSVTWTFSGLLTGYEPSAPTDDKMTATVTIKVTSSYMTGAGEEEE